jgi:hypothetical protein
MSSEVEGSRNPREMRLLCTENVVDQKLEI